MWETHSESAHGHCLVGFVFKCATHAFAVLLLAVIKQCCITAAPPSGLGVNCLYSLYGLMHRTEMPVPWRFGTNTCTVPSLISSHPTTIKTRLFTSHTFKSHPFYTLHLFSPLIRQMMHYSCQEPDNKFLLAMRHGLCVAKHQISWHLIYFYRTPVTQSSNRWQRQHCFVCVWPLLWTWNRVVIYAEGN